MIPTILLVRHGNTAYDKRVDALLDPALTYEGVQRLKRTARFLKESGFKFSRIVTSPRQRAMKAAQIIGDDNAKIYPDHAALPWNLGDLMGHWNATVDERIAHLQNYPDLKAPHGESYRTFYTRWDNLLQRVMVFAEANPSEAVVIVTHSRNIDALQSIIGGNPIGDVSNAAPEASVTQLSSHKTGSADWSYELIWEGK